MSESILKIGDILSTLLEESDINEAALSRKIGIPRATVNRLVSGRTPDPRISTLEAIARHFDISVDQLLGKQPLLNETHKKIRVGDQKLIPLIEWKNVASWKENREQMTFSNHLNWISIDSSLNQRTFGLLFTGDSMWPQFQENTVLIVDPDKEPKNRDFVVAEIHKDQEVLFRQLLMEGKCSILKAMNSAFPAISLTPEDKIVGVVVQSRKNH